MSLSTFPSQVVRGSEPEEDVLGSIQRIGRTLSPEENLRRQVQVFIEEATAITGAQCGAVFQSTATAGNELLALLGMSEETFSRLWTPRMASILHGAGTIHGDDIAMEPMEEGDAPVVSRMVIPLVSRSGEVLGGLFFGHCEPARFTGREEKIAVVLAAQVVLAIENARLSNLLQQAGRELEFSEQRYHFLAEAIPQLVWTAHPDGRVDYFNRRWDEYVGTAPGASLGTRWIEYLHPEDRQRAMEAWENALQTTHPYESEYRLMRHDQVSRWHIARALCLRDENGRIMKWFGTCTDVHDQKAVASNNAFLANASVVLSSTLAHAEVLEKIVHLAVPHFSDWCTVEVLGVEGGETRVMRAHRDPEKMALVEEVARLYPEKPDAPFGSPRVLRTGKGEYGALVTDAMLAAVAHDARHLELLRSLRFYSYICVPLRARGKLLGTMYFISAESKRIFTQKDLESAEDFAHRAAEAIENARLYEEAHAANRAKDNFLAILSHELRTPLTPVMAGIARLLESEELSEEARQEIEVMRRNIRAESRLIDDLLDITGLSKGKLCIEREPANVHALLRSAVEMCQAEAQEQGILLETHLGARHPIAQADPRRLIQVFCNLITNAIKFTPRLGKVVIRTSSSEQEMLRIEMSDTGIGIEERQIARIFEPFEQADRSITRRYGGLGLGLALARQLVEAHEGTIRAASEGRGLGATFVIQLPLAPGKPLEIAEPVSVAPLQGSGGARILLVEDHVDTRDALVKLLRRWGYEVVAVGRVDEALRKIEKETFQLLLSDIGLPDASGLELMTAVRTRTSLRGVAMSGFGSQDDIEKTREAGFEKHLTKPVGVEALKRALHEALSN